MQNHIPNQALPAQRSCCLVVAPPGGRSVPPSGKKLLALLPQNHTNIDVIRHSLALLASGTPWWQIWAPPSGKTLLASLVQNHIPRPASSAHRWHCSLEAPPVTDQGTTLWQGSYDLPWLSTKVSTQLVHRQLSIRPVKNTRTHTRSVLIKVTSQVRVKLGVDLQVHKCRSAKMIHLELQVTES